MNHQHQNASVYGRTADTEAPVTRDDAPQCSEEEPTYTPFAVEFAAGAS
jgi:hypothetical protein